jgi:hypothetical protein
MLLILLAMTNIIAADYSPSSSARSTSCLDLDGVARGLASEFPLHSTSELRRTIFDAENDLWPHRDPIDILDRARERLREGLIG